MLYTTSASKSAWQMAVNVARCASVCTLTLILSPFFTVGITVMNP